MTPDLNCFCPLFSVPLPWGVVPALLTPWFPGSSYTPLVTPEQAPCCLDLALSLRAQTGHCLFVQETGPSLLGLLTREGPSPWEEVGARGRKWAAATVTSRRTEDVSSSGRAAMFHRVVKTQAQKRMTVKVRDLRPRAICPTSSPGFLPQAAEGVW